MLGIIGKKIGMTQVFNEQGDLLPVTLLQIEPNMVVGTKTAERDGYEAVMIGAFDANTKKVSKSSSGFYKDLQPKRVIKEFRVAKSSDFERGQVVSIDSFADVKFVDVTGYSKGKGFQGVVKRWGFAGGRATHGSKFHRQNGSTGSNTQPAKSIKGLKRAGHMGFEKVTTLNLKVVKIDAEKQLMYVCGSVPGRKDTELIIRKAVKK